MHPTILVTLAIIAYNKSELRILLLCIYVMEKENYSQKVGGLA
jgi:hypothetical protein